MRAGEAILVRATWLMMRAGYEEGEVEVMRLGEEVMEPGWVLRREAAPLPHRSQIEKDHPEAIMPVEECEAGYAKMREVASEAKWDGTRPTSEAERAALYNDGAWTQLRMKFRD